MSAARIIFGLSREKMVSSLPSRYRKMIPASAIPQGGYTLMLFKSEREAVILSRYVHAGLQKLPEKRTDTLVAVGGAFTKEAQDALAESGCQIILQLSNFGWTDESYRRVRAAKQRSK